MHHEPRRFVADAEHPVNLMRAHALLAGRNQMNAEQPF